MRGDGRRGLGCRRAGRRPALRIPWYSDVRLLGRLLTTRRVWPVTGVGSHIMNGALFGAAFERLGGRGWKQGLAAYNPSSQASGVHKVIDRITAPARRRLAALAHKPLSRREIAVHALFGVGSARFSPRLSVWGWRRARALAAQRLFAKPLRVRLTAPPDTSWPHELARTGALSDGGQHGEGGAPPLSRSRAGSSRARGQPPRRRGGASAEQRDPNGYLTTGPHDYKEPDVRHLLRRPGRGRRRAALALRPGPPRHDLDPGERLGAAALHRGRAGPGCSGLSPRCSPPGRDDAADPLDVVTARRSDACAAPAGRRAVGSLSVVRGDGELSWDVAPGRQGRGHERGRLGRNRRPARARGQGRVLVPVGARSPSGEAPSSSWSGSAGVVFGLAHERTKLR